MEESRGFFNFGHEVRCGGTCLSYIEESFGYGSFVSKAFVHRSSCSRYVKRSKEFFSYRNVRVCFSFVPSVVEEKALMVFKRVLSTKGNSMISQNFQGKFAVITGAARGILKDTAVILAERGAAGIIIADLLYDKALETAQEIESVTDTRVLACKTDVSKPEDIVALIAFAQEKFGTVHILINGAGVCPTSSVAETDAAKWDRVMKINLRSVHLAIRQVLPLMQKQNYGRIVNIASISMRIGAIAASAAYAASKGGIAAVSKTYAKQNASHNITVNSVAPGVILTDMTKDNNYTAEGIPMGRLGAPRDVSAAVAFFASDDSSYITGCTLDVNGGAFMTP